MCIGVVARAGGWGVECPLSKGPNVDIIRRQKTSDLAGSEPRVPSKLLEILDLTKGMSVVEWIGVWVWLIQMRGEGICEGGILCGYGWVERGGGSAHYISVCLHYVRDYMYCTG